ncbi:hypothetical protein HII17_01555 [Thalassotalea sp. M1531]|uniref:STAS/SEC14 domain-containing protein n=1 Tax=Thalassotalea algicola TaxID=2716224 RepID=A0A7Y0L9R9_9GAMM|nr:hypothetical protein [Thalassotalea algicola]NMP30233.1 hypothetical protein [Thalassotalea algicola]
MEAHGEFNVVLNGNAIESKLKGSFNDVGFSDYVETVKRNVAKLADLPFVMMIDNSEFEGGTPEAYVVFEEYSKWISTQHVIAKVYLVSSFVQKEIMLQQTPELQNQNIEFFKEKSEARDWLAKQLAAYERQ